MMVLDNLTGVNLKSPLFKLQLYSQKGGYIGLIYCIK
jgi:hypothetical protein